jgi:hypothetical protein
MEIVTSKNNIPIRLSEQRWFHIIENHDDLAAYSDEVLRTVEEPDYIIQGYRGTFIALRKVEEGKFLAVVYKEFESDGFVITAYFTRKIRLEREAILWPKKP